MGKEILFDNEGVILKLNGVTGLLAFKLKLKCLITRSRVSMLTILMLHNGCFVCLEHQFLLSIFLKEVLNMLTNGTFSYENRVPLVMIELEGHEKYKYIFLRLMILPK